MKIYLSFLLVGTVSALQLSLVKVTDLSLIDQVSSLTLFFIDQVSSLTLFFIIILRPAAELS